MVVRYDRRGCPIDYEKAGKKLKLKFKKERFNENTEKTEVLVREYESKIGTLKIYYNLIWKYRVYINPHEKDYRHEKFGNKKKLIDYLVGIEAKYVQKYWE